MAYHTWENTLYLYPRICFASDCSGEIQSSQVSTTLRVFIYLVSLTLCAYHLDDWNSHPGSRHRPIRSAVLLDFSRIFCLLCTVRFHSVISWQPWVLLCFHHTEVYRSWVQGNLPLESTWNSSASTDLQWQSKSRCLCRGMRVGILKSVFLKYSPQMLRLLFRRRCRSEYPLWRKVL